MKTTSMFPLSTIQLDGNNDQMSRQINIQMHPSHAPKYSIHVVHAYDNPSMHEAGESLISHEF